MKQKISLCILLVCLCFAGCGSYTIPDGVYSADVTLTGGSGKAKIEEATITVKDGSKSAVIVWSSPYYEYMLIDDTKYTPIQKSGNSTFEIPIELDKEIEVSALTVAMSEPHLIEYTLFFDSKTLKGE